MPQTLALANYEDVNLIERTQLTTPLAAGVNSLPVDNTNDFETNGFILLGDVSSKKLPSYYRQTLSALLIQFRS
jgi:hypothetical protein